MRVIAGTHKGRRLQSFDAGHIRPMTDRVKESLFSKIQFHVADSRVLDLFSGTGNLGIEAISRGAKEVTFVDNHVKSIGLIKKNISEIGLENQSVVVKEDAFKFIRECPPESFDIIFADPPFPKKWAGQILDELDRSHLAAPEAIVVVEFSRHEDHPQATKKFQLLDEKKFGDKYLAFFECVSGSEL